MTNAVSHAPESLPRDVARYFVVRPEPLKMTPGLHRLGHDFGNGTVDGLHFQLDSQARAYRAAKERVLSAHPDRLTLAEDAQVKPFLIAAADFMRSTLEKEHGPVPGLMGDADRQAFVALSLGIQEDFALLLETEAGSDRLVLLSVCFPSGWRPELLLGKSFAEVHHPVPAFETVVRKSAQLVSGIVERGPYVRFVWTVTADSALDHHPDHSPRLPWSDEAGGYLRVERQTTVPFPEHRGALFLIRTYLYPFSTLTPDERKVLATAVNALPASVRDYKGLSDAVSVVLRKLSSGSFL